MDKKGLGKIIVWKKILGKMWQDLFCSRHVLQPSGNFYIFYNWDGIVPISELILQINRQFRIKNNFLTKYFLLNTIFSHQSFCKKIEAVMTIGASQPRRSKSLAMAESTCLLVKSVFSWLSVIFWRELISAWVLILLQ